VQLVDEFPAQQRSGQFPSSLHEYLRQSLPGKTGKASPEIDVPGPHRRLQDARPAIQARFPTPSPTAAQYPGPAHVSPPVEAGLEWDAQFRIHEDTNGIHPRLSRPPNIEPGIIRERRIGADENRITARTKAVYEPPCLRPRDPARLALGRCDSPIERRCEFQAHKGAPALLHREKSAVLKPACSIREDLDLDPIPAKMAHSSPIHSRIRIATADKHATQTGLDQGLYARTGASVDGTGLESDRQGSTA